MRWWATARRRGWLATSLPVCAALAASLVATVVAQRAHATADVSTLTRAEQRLAARFTSRGVAYPPRAVTLIGLKSEGRLELWADGGSGWTFVRSYLVQATSGRLGPKLRQGDRQVPEGIYQVSALNPRSRYHLALRLDYPNAFDRARGEEEGRTQLGGDIMIHGDRVSAGCLPIGDEAIEEVFALATTVGIESLSVIVAPLDFRRHDARAAAAQVKRAPRWLSHLYAALAEALAPFPLAATGTDARDLPPRKQTIAQAKCKAYDAADCERRCAKGDSASCARAGVLFRDGRGVPQDASKAWRLLTAACARGDASGCGALSGLVVDDDGTRRDTAHAAKLARSACDAGDGHACAQLADLCTDKLVYPSAAAACERDEVDRLRERAVAKLGTRCSGWGAYDCFTLATIFMLDDPDTARTFARESCQAGDPGGCDQLGFLHQLDGDVVRARALYAKACGAGYTRACRRFAGTIAVSDATAAAVPSGG
jgi:TPR repeat protein